MILIPSQAIISSRRRFFEALKGPYSRRLGLADFFGGGGGSQTPIPGFEHWTYRIPLTINNAQASTLSNVPLLIKLTTARFTYAHAQSAGQDVRVVSNDLSTIYAYEFEAWNDASGNSWIWTSIPSLPNGNTTIYLYYGNTKVLDEQNKTAVWDSNYKGVWHFPNGTTLSANDSTSNANNGTITGATAGTGQVDGAANFNGSSNISAANTNDYTNGITLELWLKTSLTSTGYFFGDGSSTVLSQANVDAGGTVTWLLYNSGTKINLTSVGTVNNNVFHKVDLIWDGTTGTNAVKIYIDGVLDKQGTSTGTLGVSQCATNIGDTRGTGCVTHGSGTQFNGLLDEVRVSNIVRSADWIAFQRNSGLDNVITYGAEQSV